MKIVFICSTNASVFKQALQTHLLDNFDIEFVSDCDCGSIEFAKEQGYPYRVLKALNGKDFSSMLANAYGNDDILFISFYTRLLTSPFIEKQAGNLINFHPSILPACPGMDGFGDTIKSGAIFIGSTVHFIDSGVDTGYPILQAAFPKKPNIEIENIRHRVFLQQVISLIQVITWFNLGLIRIGENHLIVLDVEYKLSEFSPNLDSNLKELYVSWLKSNF